MARKMAPKAFEDLRKGDIVLVCWYDACHLSVEGNGKLESKDFFAIKTNVGFFHSYETDEWGMKYLVITNELCDAQPIEYDSIPMPCIRDLIVVKRA